MKATPEIKSSEEITRWHESLVAIDLLLLHASPVFYGAGLPRGDGSPVLLIPGFMHNDLYLMVLFAWLRRIGYRPCYSGIDLNAECPDRLITRQLSPLLKELCGGSGSVHLIGHSLGGVIARSLAVQFPSRVRSLIMMGSPQHETTMHRNLLIEREAVRRFIQRRHGQSVPTTCYTANCPCRFMRSLSRVVPANITQTSIFTRGDGALDWRACRTGRSECDIEVRGTHAGLAFNADAYRAIARRLADAR